MQDFTVCKVCAKLDNDYSSKPCQFCNLCNAWICSSCWPNILRRAQAMISTIVESKPSNETAEINAPIQRKCCGK